MTVFQLDDLTEYDFGHTLAVVIGGEVLDFLDTPKENVLLTDLGRWFLAADINDRKDLFREQLLKLGLFRHLAQMLERIEEQRPTKEVVLEELVVQRAAKAEDVERLFQTVVAWGRFGEFLGYSPATEMLYPVQPGGNGGSA